MPDDPAFARTLRLGDVAVHLDHGLGRAERLVEEEGRDYLVMAFHDDKRLLVPADDLDRVWRYAGPGSTVKLDPLNGADWARRARRAADDVAEAARLLIDERDARAKAVGPPVTIDDEATAALAKSFRHTLTPDQQNAIDAVFADLASGPPMDRLVCGDVGFGKTEIAIRAAGVTAKDGFQVVVLAPTTVLAQQHVEGFKKRLEPLGLRVDALSRFVSDDEADAVRERVAAGETDVLIGTHAALSDSVTFKRLGLVVIDEEQRFGAGAKHALHERWPDVHTLALTATPIPHTLRTALIGLREMSLLQTPPSVRKPIQTRAEPWNDVAVANALREETARGGQAFVICPRVADMDAMEDTLDTLAPDAAVITAHGQLDAPTLEERMARFAKGDGDILLATNIVENGLNLPRANTIIVHRANLFGLAQLHQLRGRVGRSNVAAVALFTHDTDENLTEDARRRLATLAALDDRGAGFDLSVEDLEQRGAGDLDIVGDEQTGHIGQLGLGLFGRLLDLALAGEDIASPDALASPQIELGLDPHIPADVVPDDDTRLALYCTLARALTEDELNGAEAGLDLGDDTRPELARLMERARLRLACRNAGVAELKAGPEGLSITLREPVDAKHGARLAQDVEAALKRGVKGRIEVAWKRGLSVKATLKSPETRLALAARAVASVADRAS